MHIWAPRSGVAVVAWVVCRGGVGCISSGCACVCPGPRPGSRYFSGKHTCAFACELTQPGHRARTKTSSTGTSLLLPLCFSGERVLTVRCAEPAHELRGCFVRRRQHGRSSICLSWSFRRCTTTQSKGCGALHWQSPLGLRPLQLVATARSGRCSRPLMSPSTSLRTQASGYLTK